MADVSTEDSREWCRPGLRLHRADRRPCQMVSRPQENALFDALMIAGGHVMKVGFIGLGRMGAGMAANRLAGGHEVTVYNRTPSKVQTLVERGAHAAARVADACQGDAVITMLADDGAVEGVVFGDEGLIGSLGQGGIHISMSTISIALSARLAAAHTNAKQRFVAAPVFGRPDAAAAAKLFIVPAGAPDAVDTYSPLFEARGHRTLS